MKPSPSSEHDEQDQELIERLKDLRTSQSEYPSELLAARRAAFLAQLKQLGTVDTAEELSAADQEVVKLLGRLKSDQVEYPAELLAARRSAFLLQMQKAGDISVLDKLRTSLQKIFTPQRTLPSWPPAGFRRISLVISTLLVAVLLGSLFFPRTEESFQPAPSQAVLAPTHVLPADPAEVAITICKPDNETSSCPPGDIDPSQDLADPGNSPARPAVAKDARPSQDEAYKAAYVNDGRGGASWVSNSADSWIKIDLGQVTTINIVTLQKGNLDSSHDNDPGQFVIAVALSDVYADGDSSHDYVEYAQVFHSEQTGFSGTVSPSETIETRFPAVRARFVKITFEKAGTALEEVGVFMVEPPVLAEQPKTPVENPSGNTSTPIYTNTLLAINTSTSVATNIGLPTDTVVPILTNTLPPAASNTPIPLPTNTSPPADTSTPIPISPSPSNTPIPLPTIAPPIDPPTAIPPTIQLPAPITNTIVVAGNNQTLTFTCNGNAAEIRGHANTVTLLGSCSSITVTGNSNHVFWESGFPVITNRGRDNIVQQL